MRRGINSSVSLLTSIVLCSGLCGCALVERAGIGLFYDKAPLGETRVLRDLPYTAEENSAKQQLDLFLPKSSNWPVLVFAYGGGWTAGDKELQVGGADVYGNIGRFYAARGIGVALINYRLQPNVTWRSQAADTAAATAWVHSRIASYGGDPRRLFLAGHSSGAQLVCHVALNDALLAKHGLSTDIICGVVSVSGAGLDLTDQRTYELGADPDYYAARFKDGSGSWQTRASPVSYATSNAPPFLLLYAAGEDDSLQRQSERLATVLRDRGVPAEIVVVPGQSHSRIVLTLSRPDKTAGPAILRFIESHRCAEKGGD